jgi:hypothetical protein
MLETGSGSHIAFPSSYALFMILCIFIILSHVKHYNFCELI